MAFEEPRTFLRVSELAHDSDPSLLVDILAGDGSEQIEVLDIDACASANSPNRHDVAIISLRGQQSLLKERVVEAFRLRRPDLRPSFDFYGWTPLYQSGTGAPVVEYGLYAPCVC